MTLEADSEKTIELLLIEDNDTDFLLLERQVKKILSPLRITRAANRIELLDALRRDYDLIVTDFHLPGAEGEALLQMIDAAQPATPCILMSGSSDEFASVRSSASVIAKLEKGNHAALSEALRAACAAIGIASKNI